MNDDLLRVEDVAPAAGAGKDEPGGVEPREGGAVAVAAGTLGDHRFLPGEAEPAQVLDHGRDEIEPEPDGVEVVAAQQQGPAGGLGAALGEPEGAGVSEVQVPGGRGGQAAAVAGGGHG